MLNKKIISEAIVEAKEIEKFAFVKARKAVEDSLGPQIEKLIQETIENNLKNSKETSQEEVNAISENSNLLESEEIKNKDIIKTEEDNKIEEGISLQNVETENKSNIKNISEMSEIHNENEELYEVEGLYEEEPIQEPQEESIEDKLDDLSSKLDQVIAAVQGEQQVASAEGEVEVVDDEETAAVAPEENPAPAPAPAEAPAPASAPAPEEIEAVNEDDEIELDFDELSELEVMEDGADSIFEIELDDIENTNDDDEVFEISIDDEDEIEESRGLAFSSKNRGDRFNHDALPDHAPVTTPAKGLNESKKEIKNKAQNESNVDELLKENESLKKVIKTYKSNLKEFENSFVELKSQLNEMQIFNGKLAYANRLLTKGGLSNDEKIRIAEEFDKCSSVEEAKKLYNKLISENKFSSKENITDKLKSATPKTAKPSQVSEQKTEKLFESEERKRMKKLAGLIKLND